VTTSPGRWSGQLAAQTSLFAGGPPVIHPDPAFERIDLGGGAWVDVARDWLGGADELCIRLIERVDWRHHRRWMYDRIVDEPRLTRWYDANEALPEEALAWFRVAVGRRYDVRFGAVGLNFYRDGHDSVASHSDRELRDLDDTMVAIVTLGAARPFLLRPQGGGASIDLHPASGDLLVMGGTCQAGWEHAVPKVAAGAGPRVSASIRWARGAGGAEQKWAPPDRQPSPGPAPQTSAPQQPARRTSAGTEEKVDPTQAPALHASEPNGPTGQTPP
jgi:alkylated DNA repair dioxygenase AlkB